MGEEGSRDHPMPRPHPPQSWFGLGNISNITSMVSNLPSPLRDVQMPNLTELSASASSRLSAVLGRAAENFFSPSVIAAGVGGGDVVALAASPTAGPAAETAPASAPAPATVPLKFDLEEE